MTVKVRTRWISADKEKNEILVHFWRHFNKPSFFHFSRGSLKQLCFPSGRQTIASKLFLREHS